MPCWPWDTAPFWFQPVAVGPLVPGGMSQSCQPWALYSSNSVKVSPYELCCYLRDYGVSVTTELTNSTRGGMRLSGDFPMRLSNACQKEWQWVQRVCKFSGELFV